MPQRYFALVFESAAAQTSARRALVFGWRQAGGRRQLVSYTHYTCVALVNVPTTLEVARAHRRALRWVAGTL